VDGFQDAIIQPLEFSIFYSSIQILETPKDILMRSKYFIWILISYSTFVFLLKISIQLEVFFIVLKPYYQAFTIFYYKRNKATYNEAER
jgi:hypothetical protein